MNPRLVLYQPDIPQNTASFIRLAACMACELHIIEPCGFPFDTREMKRVMMDYFTLATITRHDSWLQFLLYQKDQTGKLILMTTRASVNYTECEFTPGDFLLFGRESSGVPDEVHQAADARIKIPLAPKARSLNVALSASMVLGEAIRQIHGQ